MSRRSAEQELLNIGQAIESALHSYAGVRPTAGTQAGVPAGMPMASGPKNLEDLLKDPRTPALRRHLRKVYADPLTGHSNWGLVLDANGHIVGVHSLASGTPIQRNGFAPHHAHFEEAQSYQDWVFGLPQARPAVPTR